MEQQEAHQKPVEEQTEVNQGEASVEPMEGNTDPDSQEAETHELALLQQKVDEMKDKYLRLYADFDNYKKRMAKEKQEWIATASKDVILSLLPVLDDIERASRALQETQDVEAVKEGFKLVQHKLKSSLESKGLKEMDTQGVIFDPEFHEALSELPASHEEQIGKILITETKGYYLHDKLIRHARVVVGK